MKEYYFIIEGDDNRYIMESGDSIKDNYFELSHIYDDVLFSIPSSNLKVGDDFEHLDVYKEEIQHYITANYSHLKLIVYADDTIVNEYNLADVVNDGIWYYLDAENYDIKVGSFWSTQLQNYIDNSIWQVALKADGILITDQSKWPQPRVTESNNVMWELEGVLLEPTMWFGLKDQDALSKWIVGEDNIPALVTEENGLGDYGGQYCIQGFELNYDSLYDPSVIDWYFGCGGNEGADFSEMLKTCPIDLKELYECGNGKQQIMHYCYSLQLDTK